MRTNAEFMEIVYGWMDGIVASDDAIQAARLHIVPPPDGGVVTIDLPAAEISRLARLKLVSNKSHAVESAALVEIVAGKLLVTITDSYRLAQQIFTPEAELGEGYARVVVDRQMLNDAAKMVGASKHDRHGVRCRLDAGGLSLKNLDTQAEGMAAASQIGFPDYRLLLRRNVLAYRASTEPAPVVCFDAARLVELIPTTGWLPKQIPSPLGGLYFRTPAANQPLVVGLVSESALRWWGVLMPIRPA
jgi:hypothetical protein